MGPKNVHFQQVSSDNNDVIWGPHFERHCPEQFPKEVLDQIMDFNSDIIYFALDRVR